MVNGMVGCVDHLRKKQYVHLMFFTYITCNRKQGALYTGHTDDLGLRIWEHKEGVYEGFSKRYNCTRLVWFELHQSRDQAFRRERQIKEWKRAWKIELLETLNPDWDDLYPTLTEDSIYCQDRMSAAASGDGPRLSSG